MSPPSTSKPATGDQPCPVCGVGALDTQRRMSAEVGATRLEVEAASWWEAQQAASTATDAVRRFPSVPGAPAKVDGLAQVLAEVAKGRQVIGVHP